MNFLDIAILIALGCWAALAVASVRRQKKAGGGCGGCSGCGGGCSGCPHGKA